MRVCLCAVCRAAGFAALLYSCATPPAVPALFAKNRAAHIASAEIHWRRYTEGIDAAFIQIENPRLEAWALRIDLRNPALEIVMNSGERGAASIPSTTVSSFLLKYRCVAALNAGPFAPVSRREDEKRTLAGIFIAEGVEASPPHPPWGALVVFDSGAAAILPQEKIRGLSGVRWAAGGFHIVLQGGVIMQQMGKARHPRSAAGLADGGRTLILLAIDGRRTGSAGATQTELGALLKVFGAEDGLNFDGGGSTALALLYNGGALVANRPRGGIFGGERAVATCVGVRAVFDRKDFSCQNPQSVLK